MKSKMTIHRALSELKVIDSRIYKAMSELNPIGIKQKDKLVDGKHNVETFNKNANETFQSIQDLIERKSKIKNAIVLSNAKTLVKIGEKEMSVADAITAKSHAEIEQEFINNLKAKARKAKSNLEQKNAEVESRKEKFIEASLGGDKSKAKPEEVESLSKMFDTNNMYEIVDPINVEDKIKKMETNLEEFLGEVDAVLSETNATTFITV